MKKVGKVLVVDDNAGIRSALKILLPMRFEAVEILPSPAQLISTVNALPAGCDPAGHEFQH